MAVDEDNAQHSDEVMYKKICIEKEDNKEQDGVKYVGSQRVFKIFQF